MTKIFLQYISHIITKKYATVAIPQCSAHHQQHCVKDLQCARPAIVGSCRAHNVGGSTRAPVQMLGQQPVKMMPHSNDVCSDMPNGFF